jgi:signal transduction histidine kinase
MLVLAFPTLAPAADGEASFTGATYGVGLGIGLILGLIGMLWLSRRQNTRFKAKGAATAAERDALNASLEAAPDGVYLWRARDEGELFSSRLETLMGANPKSLTRFDRLADHLPVEDFARLKIAVDGLRATRTPFSLELATDEGARRLEVDGAMRGDGEEAVLALWFKDVTRHANEIATLKERLAAMESDASRWHALLDGFDFPVWLRERNGNIAWCNKAYAAWVESTVEKVIRNGEIELVSGYAAKQAKQLASRALTTGEPQSEKHHAVVAGQRRLVQIVERAVADDLGTLGVARDVTDIEVAETELARHIAAHAEVLDSLGTAIGIYTPDKRLNYFNNAFPKLFHLDESWLRTEPRLGDVLEALRENRQLPEQADFPAYKKKQNDLFTSLTQPMERLLHLPGGSTLREVVTPHPFGGLLFLSEDVTDRLALERSYNTLIAVQRATLDQLKEAVAVFGGDGRLRLYNPDFAKLWRLEDAMLKNEPHIAEIVEVTKELYDYGEDWKGYKAELIARTTEHAQHSERIERRDGKVLDCTTVPLPDGKILRTFLDITDSIQVERALRERTEALETADRLKSEFVANVSYELRTPLNTVIGFTEILTNEFFGSLNERQREYSEGILESSQHLLSLINDILDLASIEAGRLVIEKEEFDIREILESVLSLASEPVTKKELEVKLDCPADTGTLDADPRRVKQALFNLLSNAIKFTPPKGSVTLGARRDANGVALWVADTGVGIAEPEKGHVFEKFYRGSRSVTRQSGTGLGLALVKSFVELHGGRIELESSLKTGTKVTCFFPDSARGGEVARA